MRIEIKNRITSDILFSGEYESVKDAVKAAIRSNANLRYANLYNANLYNADLRYANLSNANLYDANLYNADLRYANLSNADLRYANLYNADLRYANLYNADLRYANLRYANLRYANLSNANLRYADLRYANLSNANLHDANLYNADLSNANLRYANLRYANLYNADLSNANLSNANLYDFLPEGPFIGWKKVRAISGETIILKVQIPENARRLNYVAGRKCRASYVIPLEAHDLKHNKLTGISEFKAMHDGSSYQLGVPFYPDKFDDDARIECSNGVHFFITFQEAIDY